MLQGSTFMGGDGPKYKDKDSEEMRPLPYKMFMHQSINIPSGSVRFQLCYVRVMSPQPQALQGNRTGSQCRVHDAGKPHVPPDAQSAKADRATPGPLTAQGP